MNDEIPEPPTEFQVEPRQGIFQKIRRLILGSERNPFDSSIFHNMALLPFFAWVGLGADGLSSSSYGPEEAWHVLNSPHTGFHPYLGLFVALGTAITVFVLSAAYSQIIEMFPSGGGGYLVASKLLSPSVGMVSGCALLIDYVLTIAISIAAGADAIFSFLPPDLIQFKFMTVVGGILLLTILNLRGVKESIGVMVPIFLVFVFTHAFAIIYALATHVGEVPRLAVETQRDVSQTASALGYMGLFMLIMKAYSMGAGTYTGIEAVSNGMNILREPRLKNGKRTMRYMSISLAITAVGLILAYLFYEVQKVEGKTLNAVLFEKMAMNWGQWGSAFVWVTLFSEAAILFIAAQAGFIGGPRVVANLALDRWFPSRFAMLSDRLVTHNGVLVMSLMALGTILFTHGSVQMLVVLYSINVFITFALSMLGMVKHWWTSRNKEAHWKRKFAVVFSGLLLSTFILLFVVIFKFNDGGWATLLVTGSLVGFAILVKRHYKDTEKLLGRLDGLVKAANSGAAVTNTKPVPEADPKGKTAVFLVNGFNGLGLHTLLNIQRLFTGVYKNFVFVHVGLVDAGNFKGVEEMEALKQHVESEGMKYVDFMNRYGFYAESITAVGIDVVSEAAELVPEILKRFPQSIFFGGQLVFPEDTFFTRFLHNNIVFAVQRRFYNQGIPFVILPVRVY
jgi:amino acid transporter